MAAARIRAGGNMLTQMKIRAALGFNLTDYPGKIAAVVFVPGCNYACPACHAKPLLGGGELIEADSFFKYLDGVRHWVNGVVVCGGEPTLEAGLAEFMGRLKAEGLSVKLDTNGSAPRVMERLLAEKLADYAALDVKGPQELWTEATGRPDAGAAIMESIALAARFPDYEFRTTAVPIVRGKGDISFLTAAEIGGTARLIAQITGSGAHKYYIQKFVPRPGGLLDKRLEDFPETPPELLESMRREASAYLPNCGIRG